MPVDVPYKMSRLRDLKAGQLYRQIYQGKETWRFALANENSTLYGAVLAGSDKSPFSFNARLSDALVQNYSDHWRLLPGEMISDAGQSREAAMGDGGLFAGLEGHVLTLWDHERKGQPIYFNLDSHEFSSGLPSEFFAFSSWKLQVMQTSNREDGYSDVLNANFRDGNFTFERSNKLV